MKKLILFVGVLITALTLNSCSNDGDNDFHYLDKVDNIVGKWSLRQLLIDNIDQQIDECQKKMTIEVSDNGTFFGKGFRYNDVQSECVYYNIFYGFWHNVGNSNYVITGLKTQNVIITFEDNKIIAEYLEEIEGISYSIKTIFAAESNVVPDQIIGKWRSDQEFFDDEEVIVSECEKKGTIQFFEDGIFKEIEFEENETKADCVQINEKTGTWKNIGDSFYKMSNINVDETIKITFESGKMIVEFNSEEEGEWHKIKIIFINANN